MIHRKAGRKQEMQPQRPSVCCCALCLPAAFGQMQETIRATYQTDHTRPREQCAGQRASHGHGYSWLLSSGEKEVRGECSVWEVLTGKGKDEGAKQCRRSCWLHTRVYRENKRKKREKKKEMSMDIKRWENLHPGSQPENQSLISLAVFLLSIAWLDCALAVVVVWV